MRKACLAETGVDVKLVDASKNGNLPDDPQLRCYILCLMEHAGIINDAGVVNFSLIYHLFTPDTKASFVDATNDCGTIRNYLQNTFIQQFS